jgi:hypothetical protein
MNRGCYFIAILIFFLNQGNAQVTSGELRGNIKDEKGEVLPGVNVQAVHTPTQTVYGSVSFADGSFVITNLKTGGPYVVTVSFVGYQTESVEALFIQLGDVQRLSFLLKESATQLEEVQVTASSAELSGASQNFGKEKISELPTLNRSLQDITRLSPQASGSSFAGSNYRFNNLSIDGVASNDAFGFQEPSIASGGSVASGTPGALSRTQPISLDAIEEVQVLVAPFSVVNGNFTGASLNAVTRSGTNKIEGSWYAFGRSSTTTRSELKGQTLADFYDGQTGIRIGGPIIRNKLFYFLNVERTARKESLLFAPGSSTSAFPLEIAQAIVDTLQTRYGFDSGPIQNQSINNGSSKVFLRLDWNINTKHQLTLRSNFVAGDAGHLQRGPSLFNFYSQGFTHYSDNFNSALQLKSRLSNNLSNDLTIGYSNLHDYRTPFGNAFFPHIEITYNTGNTLFAGTYREAAIFQMKQNTFEFTDNLTFFKEKSTFTIGTHNEYYRFNYHFVTPWNGRWAYRSPADFFANKPSRIRSTYNFVDDSQEYNYNRPSADFSVLLAGLYAQHEYALSSKINFTYGIRVDGNIFPDSPNLTADLQKNTTLANYSSGISAQWVVSPRFGFTADVIENKLKLRGGSGIFAGRMPFAWMAYAYIYNGSQFGNIDIRPTGTVPLVTENFSNLKNIQPSLREINVVDKNMKMPRVWRSNIAVEWKLKGDWSFTLEAVYSKTLYDALFKTLNLKDSTISLQGADTRAIYPASKNKYDPQYTSVFQVTNTQKGYRYNISFTANKRLKNTEVFATYTFGESKDIANGVRVSPQANWEWNQTVTPNAPELSYSNFDIRHRIISGVNYNHIWKNQSRSLVSLIVSGQSGSPFTYVYNGDLNRDGSPMNDLIFIPATKEQINLVDIVDGTGKVLVSSDEQWNNLNEFIENDGYLSQHRGQVSQRNGARTPWNVQADVRLSHQWRIKNTFLKTFELSLDVINLTNLISNEWGIQYFVPNTTNSSYSLVTLRSVSADGKPSYQFNKPSSSPWQYDALASRWQAQLGVRIGF